jgi:hypothetical protein
VAAGYPLASFALAAGGRQGSITNVHVTHDHFGVHVEPSVAANPRNPRELLVACQASLTANPTLIATYISSDGSVSWQNGGRLPFPAGGPASDDATVTFDPDGRGYLCATRAGGDSGDGGQGSDANRAVYVWRTDDSGHSFSPPATLLSGQYCDHPGIAAGAGEAPTQRNVYVVWASTRGPQGGNLAMRRSADGGQTFEPARAILSDHRRSLVSAGPRIAAGDGGLVCAVCDQAARPDTSGDIVGQAVAVCSTDGGATFGAPIALGPEVLDISLPGGVIANTGVAVGAAPHGNSLYVAFSTHTPGAIHADIAVQASHDRGRTWSAPVIATPNNHVTYFQPNVAVDAGGRVAVSAFALANGRVDEILLLSQAGALHFAPPWTVTTTPFNPHSPTASGGKHGAWWIGDYRGITAASTSFHLVWNDTRSGRLDLYAASLRASR